MKEYLVTMVVNVPDKTTEQGVRHIVGSRMAAGNPSLLTASGFTVDKSEGGLIVPYDNVCPACGQKHSSHQAVSE